MKAEKNDRGEAAVLSMEQQAKAAGIDPDKTGYVYCGGTIEEGFLPQSRDKAFLVAADRGLVYLSRHGVQPDLIVGDFDSAPEGYVEHYLAEHKGTKVLAFDPEKDYTDSEIGARAALASGCGRIVLIGATGTRLDHVLGNIQVLEYLLSEGCRGEIVDSHNRISIHKSPFSIRKDRQWGKYVSLFAIDGPVKGLTLKGFHYPVTDFTLTSVGSRAVSNEIDEAEGKIFFTSGKLLVIESGDLPASQRKFTDTLQQ